MKRWISMVLCLVLTACLLTGCGSSESDRYVDAPMEEMAQDSVNGLAQESGSARTPLPDNRKWVITCHMEAETEDLDTLLEKVTEQIRQLEGYVEQQEVYNGSQYDGYGGRSARLTVRIPAEQADAFLQTVKDQANVVSSNRNVEDITLQYTDTETRLTALRTEEGRLLELMEQAETMADLLEIEQRLTDVRYEIENITARLRTYDNQVNFATIHLQLQEVREYTPVEEPGFFEMISEGFVRSLKGVGRGARNITAYLIISLPYLVVWSILGIGMYLIIRACIRRSGRKPGKKKKSRKLPEEPEQPEKPNT